MTAFSRQLGLGICAALWTVCFAINADAQVSAPSVASPFSEKAEFIRYAERLRESVLLSLEPEVRIPSQPSFGLPSRQPAFSNATVSNRYPWKNKLVTTIFWVGESASTNNPVHNRSSSWDLKWKESFGGFDNPDPTKRRGFFPASQRRNQPPGSDWYFPARAWPARSPRA